MCVRFVIGTIKVWTNDSGRYTIQKTLTVTGHGGRVKALTFVPETKTLFSGYTEFHENGGIIKVWRV